MSFWTLLRFVSNHNVYEGSQDDTYLSGTTLETETPRYSEDRKSTSNSADRNHDRFRNAAFTYPADFDPTAHVRLFRVTKRDRHRVEGNFVRVAIGDLRKTTYKALSYTWGSANTDEDIHNISLCGDHFYIRNNLWDFFMRTREAWEGQLLYIDAICIDQRNVKERTEQVKHMAEIYKQANGVYAWLGTPEQKNHKTITEALEDCLAQDSHQRSWEPNALSGLAHLCSRPYWTRLWIVQELLLARDVTIFYGKWRFKIDDITKLQRMVNDTDISLDEMTWWMAWIFNQPDASVDQNRAYIEDGWQNGWKMLHRRRAWKLASGRKPGPQDTALCKAAQKGFALHKAIGYFSKQQCKDPKDKVFALLGLLERDEKNAISPNYESEPKHVYGQALAVGLLALQRDVECKALRDGFYPGDEYHDFAKDLRQILRLKAQDVEAQTDEAFRSRAFRDNFVANCQREDGRCWKANNMEALAEIESKIIHDFLVLTEGKVTSGRAFKLLVDIQGKLHFTSAAFSAAKSEMFSKRNFTRVQGKQSLLYRWTATAADGWTLATHFRRWKPFGGRRKS